jgi:glyoxylase-like metal-dependent hydrolase (beta-lactamase superfamily II)
VTRQPERFDAGDGRLYRIPLDLFPGLSGYAHLVLVPARESLERPRSVPKGSGRGLAILIDAGSGFGESNEQLEAGMDAVRQTYGEPVGWADLTHVLISHGHIDHYGGLSYVRQRTQAPVGIHRLDRPLLKEHDRRLEAMAGRLQRFLRVAAVRDEERQELMELYLFTKQLFTPQDVDFVVSRRESRLGPLEVLHVPGHCPGQLVVRVGDVLFTSDHVLPGITPHMAPASLARHTGLAEYLASLDRLGPWAREARLGIGGHGPPIDDVAGRIEEIRSHHEDRLRTVLRSIEGSSTIVEIADRLFPNAGGYHRLLALEEVGAHVEFLQERRLIEVAARAASGARTFRVRQAEPPSILRTARPVS